MATTRHYLTKHEVNSALIEFVKKRDTLSLVLPIARESIVAYWPHKPTIADSFCEWLASMNDGDMVLTVELEEMQPAGDA